MNPSSNEKDRFTLMVECLPEPEKTIVNGLFWERASYRELAERLDWHLDDGAPAAWKVQQAERKAFKMLRKLADILRLDFQVMYHSLPEGYYDHE